MPRNLILAYIATWVIHGCYLAFLFTRQRKLKQAAREGSTGGR
jgi:CcmD family protein